jgi:hypothetical protein
MGEIAKSLLMKMCAEASVEAVNDLLHTSQLLGGLAKAIMTEPDAEGIVNPEQLIEAAARCIDAIEVIVEACRPRDHDLSEWEQTDLHNDMMDVRGKLDDLRSQLFKIPKEDS